MSSFAFTCLRCGGSIGPPPDGANAHICRDLRPPVEFHPEGSGEPTFVDLIVEHANPAAREMPPAELAKLERDVAAQRDAKRE